MFKVGQKVVCIDAANQNYGGLIENEIYTVRAIIDFHGFLGVYLEETQIPISGITGFEVGHKIERFRELDHSFADEVIKMICEEPETIEI